MINQTQTDGNQEMRDILTDSGWFTEVEVEETIDSILEDIEESGDAYDTAIAMAKFEVETHEEYNN